MITFSLISIPYVCDISCQDHYVNRYITVKKKNTTFIEVKATQNFCDYQVKVTMSSAKSSIALPGMRLLKWEDICFPHDSPDTTKSGKFIESEVVGSCYPFKLRISNGKSFYAK